MLRTTRLVIAVLALVAASCDSTPPALDRSCRGERVLECDPHEYTAVRVATLEPSALRPLDPMGAATVHVELDACEMRPGRAEVQLFALIPRDPEAPDAGPEGLRLVDLGLAMRDDGTGGDATADDGVIDKALGNPFGREIPGDAEITLRFVPVLAGCQGDPLEIPYTTGDRFEP
jgi:hypothetical protein